MSGAAASLARVRSQTARMAEGFLSVDEVEVALRLPQFDGHLREWAAAAALAAQARRDFARAADARRRLIASMREGDVGTSDLASILDVTRQRVLQIEQRQLAGGEAA